MTTGKDDITRLLIAFDGGDRDAFDRLFEMVYSELRNQARIQLASLPGTGTLTTTALVHEVYLKLLAASQPRWQDRRHFYLIAARAMRQIIIDHARRARALKRGEGMTRIEMQHTDLSVSDHAETFLALEQALDSLALRSERMANVVELHYYAGLSFREVAYALDVSDRTVKRDWRLARAFLHDRLDRLSPA